MGEPRGPTGVYSLATDRLQEEGFDAAECLEALEAHREQLAERVDRPGAGFGVTD